MHVDLSAVTFLDSWIIGVLVSARQAAAAAGRRFLVLHPRGHVRRVLDLTGVLTTLAADST